MRTRSPRLNRGATSAGARTDALVATTTETIPAVSIVFGALPLATLSTGRMRANAGVKFLARHEASLDQRLFEGKQFVGWIDPGAGHHFGAVAGPLCSS